VHDGGHRTSVDLWKSDGRVALSKPIVAQEMVALLESLAAGGVPAAPSPSAPEPTSLPIASVFDAESALRRCLKRPEILGEIIQCFFNDVENVLPQVRAALERGDLAEVGHLGHRLKGTVVNLCADAARQAAFRVEQFMLRPGDRADAEEAVGALERECEVLKAAFAEHRSRIYPRDEG